MSRSSCSRKASSCSDRPRRSSAAPKPRFSCSSRKPTGASSYGRWISKGVDADFKKGRRDIEQRLDDICSTYLRELPAPVGEAVQYGLKSPGKRLRPLLLLFAYRAAGGY